MHATESLKSHSPIVLALAIDNEEINRVKEIIKLIDFNALFKIITVTYIILLTIHL